MALLCTLGAVVMRSACSNAVGMYDAAHSRVGAVMMSAPRLDKPDFRYGTGRTFEERDLGHGYSVGFRSMKRIEPTRDASPPVTVPPSRTTPSDSRLPGMGFVVPTMASQDAAKAAWLAKTNARQWGVRPMAPPAATSPAEPPPQLTVAAPATVLDLHGGYSSRRDIQLQRVDLVLG